MDSRSGGIETHDGDHVLGAIRDVEPAAGRIEGEGVGRSAEEIAGFRLNPEGLDDGAGAGVDDARRRFGLRGSGAGLDEGFGAGVDDAQGIGGGIGADDVVAVW